MEFLDGIIAFSVWFWVSFFFSIPISIFLQIGFVDLFTDKNWSGEFIIVAIQLIELLFGFLCGLLAEVFIISSF